MSSRSTEPVSSRTARPAPHRALLAGRKRVFACALAGILAGACTGTGAPPASRVTSLQTAIGAGDLVAADRLIASDPSLDTRRALDLAIRSGRIAVVRHYLPRAGADAVLDEDATTPLIRAVVDAPPTQRAAIVSVLLQAGATPVKADRGGLTARAHAQALGRFDLVEQLDAHTRIDPPSGDAALVRWLGATEIVAAGSSAVTVQPLRATPTPVTIERLLTGSPWLPVRREPDTEMAALRFHADGQADVLRHGASAVRFPPMVGSAAAWSLDAGGVRLGFVSSAFNAACVGRLESDVLVLSCEARQVPTLVDVAHARDLARALLADPPRRSAEDAREEALLSIATGRTPVLAGASSGNASRRVVMSGLGSGAACMLKPPRATMALPNPNVRGDWYALDLATLRSSAPLSGAHCTQPQAQAGAMRACESGGGQACISVGGCPSGQVSALAGLAGVKGAWVGCGTTPELARRRALVACSSELDCDCQLLAISGANLVPVMRRDDCEAARPSAGSG